jgi:hypothetical protein
VPAAVNSEITAEALRTQRLFFSVAGERPATEKGFLYCGANPAGGSGAIGVGVGIGFGIVRFARGRAGIVSIRGGELKCRFRYRTRVRHAASRTLDPSAP